MPSHLRQYVGKMVKAILHNRKYAGSNLPRKKKLNSIYKSYRPISVKSYSKVVQPEEVKPYEVVIVDVRREEKIFVYRIFRFGKAYYQGKYHYLKDTNGYLELCRSVQLNDNCNKAQGVSVSRFKDLVFWLKKIVVCTQFEVEGWIRDLTQEGVEPNPGPRGKMVKTSKGMIVRKKGKGKVKKNEIVRTKGTQTVVKVRPVLMPEIFYDKVMYVLDFFGFLGSNYGIKSFDSLNNDQEYSILTTPMAGLKELLAFYIQNLIYKTFTELSAASKNRVHMKIAIVYSVQRLDTLIGTWQDAKDLIENAKKYGLSAATIEIYGTPDNGEIRSS